MSNSVNSLMARPVGVVLIRLIRRDPTTSPLISTAFFYFGMPSNVGDSVELKAYRMCNGVSFCLRKIDIYIYIYIYIYILQLYISL